MAEQQKVPSKELAAILAKGPAAETRSGYERTRTTDAGVLIMVCLVGGSHEKVRLWRSWPLALLVAAAVTMSVLLGCREKTKPPATQAAGKAGGAAAGAMKAAGPIDSGWSKAVNGLRARVLCEKATFVEGEPIEITLELQCFGEKDYTYPEKPLRGCQLFPHVYVYIGKECKRVRLMAYNRVSILKGKIFRRMLRLSELIALDKPGKYAIRAGHSNYYTSDVGDWTGDAVSPAVTITVVQTDKPRPKDAAAIARRRMVRQTMFNGRVHFSAGRPTFEEVIETISRQSGVRIQPNWVELAKLNLTPKRKLFFQFDRSTTPLNVLGEVLGGRVGFATDRVLYISSKAEINRLAGRVPAGPVAPEDIAWGKANNGPRARIEASRYLSKRLGMEVGVGFENVSKASFAIDFGELQALSWKITDAAGKEVEPAKVERSQPVPDWHSLIPGQSIGRILGTAVHNRDGRLKIGFHEWKLKPGRYSIHCFLSLQSDAVGKPSGQTAWRGKIELPPAEFEVIGEVSDKDLIEAGKQVRAAHPAGGLAMWRALAKLVRPGMTVRQMHLVLPVHLVLPAREPSSKAGVLHSRHVSTGIGQISTWMGQNFILRYSLDDAFGVEASGVGNTSGAPTTRPSGLTGDEYMVLTSTPSTTARENEACSAPATSTSRGARSWPSCPTRRRWRPSGRRCGPSTTTRSTSRSSADEEANRLVDIPMRAPWHL